MKIILPLLILFLSSLSLLLSAHPVNAQIPQSNNYVAQPGDSLWNLASNMVEKATLYQGAGEWTRVQATNAVKNLEIINNNLDNTNYYLEIGQTYSLPTQNQANDLTYQISKLIATVGYADVSNILPENAAYLLANPPSHPNWSTMRAIAQNLSMNISPQAPTPVTSGQTKPEPVGTPVTNQQLPTELPNNPAPSQTNSQPLAPPSSPQAVNQQLPTEIPDNPVVEPSTVNPQVKGAHTVFIPYADDPGL